jgi:hypothetical protein
VTVWKRSGVWFDAVVGKLEDQEEGTMTTFLERPALSEVRIIQFAIAAVFIVLGAWCVVAPESVVDLTVREEHRSRAPFLLVTIGAFGAQAVLGGVIVATTRFTRTTFLCLGLAILPFFVFDWWFFAVTPLFNELILLDVAGNVVFVALCVRGYIILAPKT